MAEAPFPMLAELAQRPGLSKLLTSLGDGTSRLVGGAVRDSLLNLPVQDLDLATTLSPYEVMRRAGAAGIKTIPTGITHGTVTAVSSGQLIEVTTLRSDISTDGRRATVAFTDDWREDAERRDFTMNALYYDPATRELKDYFGGLADLEARRIRFIGDPLRRIAEDHLRILRFFRFHARFGRGELDSEGVQACLARANDLMALSRERIADELLKLLALPDPSNTVRIMVEGGVLRAVLPEITPAALSRLQQLIRSEASARLEPDGLRRLAALLPEDAVTAEKIAVRLKLSNKARKRLALAAGTELDRNAHALAYWIGKESATDRLLLAGRAEDAGALQEWIVPRMPIGGGALIRRGLDAGPAVARTLQAIERRWVAEGFPAGERFGNIVDAALANSE
jgi:poly(A) polymerase